MVNAKEGAVLVVGGGIGGIQTALDLADSGFYVYLAEEGPAIGGRMAQLDKTFPTNDCAMCMLSPKLVEAGRHHNIKILPDTELLDLEGEPGHFIARLRRKPRYIDIEKCIGCGDCEKVCPITLPDGFNGNLSQRKATYRLYPQAIPGAYAIEKRGISPCKNACPAETSAQGYIALIAQRRYAEALEVIKQYNPFPASVGRVCHHPCERACNRGKVDEPLAICALKRFVADHQAGEPVTSLERKYPEEVAVVGSGPAGLSCAHHLARLGYQTTVFEALPVAGGMMRVGIPAYRLPRDVLEREIDDIRKEGVEIRLNSPIRDVNALFREGYKAIFLAVGAHQPQELGIPGEKGPGVLYGVGFLRQVSLGQPVQLGERALVIGGGNTAIDCARTALRLGAKSVTLLYRRTRAEMPALPQEVETGEAEGVKLEFLAAPVEVLRENGRLQGVRCLRMQLAEPDASGRRRPVPIEGSEFVLEVDTMVAAVAQAPEISLLNPDHGLAISAEGTFTADRETLATNQPGIFAGGDAAQGPGMLIEAIAAGSRGAISIHRYLRSLPLRTVKEAKPLPVAELTEGELKEKLASGQIQPRGRSEALTRPALERVSDFSEVELGLTEEQAVEEAQRCLTCGICAECYQCVKACQAQAIDHEMVERFEELRVGAVVLAPGFETYNAQLSGEYGFGRYANVVTSVQFERLLSASGPTLGKILRPSDQRPPRRIAFIQCVGSRDLRHQSYCSAVCCMYATKEAVVAKEHDREIEPTIFYIDLRAYGKGFAQLVERAQEQGIRYVRSMISQVVEIPGTKNLLIRYREGGSGGQVIREEEFDLVVLSVGLRPHVKGVALAQRLGIELNEHGFVKTKASSPVASSREGIFVTGAFTGPKDIPETVVQAGAAAAAAGGLLGTARGMRVHEKHYPQEVTVDGGPRIGVFICHCGSNIAGVVDVKAVADYARTLPGVIHSENILYTCSQDNLKHMKQLIGEKNLNRIVVASCTPRNLEGLFQDTIREAGLNKFLFEMVNIREQCSWVHSDQPQQATEKAKTLVRMGVAKAQGLKPLALQTVSMTPKALVLGGGLSGMTAAVTLADSGFETFLVEKGAELGNDLKGLYRTLEGDDVQRLRAELIKQTQAHSSIRTYTSATIKELSGFVGNFSTLIATPGGEERIEHGIVIVAAETEEYKPSEHLYGQDERVLTQRELERFVHEDPGALRGMKTMVMIQCVGRDEKHPYCSRVCCGEAIKNGLALVEQDPERRIYVLYREMMAYGLIEDHYRKARERGIIFIRYDEQASPKAQDQNGQLLISVDDTRLNREIMIAADLLVLSTGQVPDLGNESVGRLLKIPIDAHGFFVEAHVKLRPVDFASHGIFLCGASHAPGTIPELIAKAQAAAGRAATVLSKQNLEAGGIVAVVEGEKCTSCLTCVRECPYGAIFINQEGLAEVEAVKCQGCGVCAADCPVKAIQLRQFEDGQELLMIEELFAGVES
jgi:heterodisulfide reductase subunit A-like polyferredoxin